MANSFPVATRRREGEVVSRSASPVSRKSHPRELIEDDDEPLTFVPISAALAAEVERLHPQTVQRASNRSSRRVVTKTTTERLVIEDDHQEEPTHAALRDEGGVFSFVCGKMFYVGLVLLAAGCGTTGLYQLMTGNLAAAVGLFILMGVFATGSISAKESLS